MNLKNKKIGIWGFGVAGKGALEFFSHQNLGTTVMDTKELTIPEQSLIEKYNSTFIHQNENELFFNHNDIILVSPGVDTRPFANFKNKFVSELDVFRHYFHKPVIAITGTIGKTSVTHLLSTILGAHKTVVTGGNIGKSMLSLIPQQTSADYGILEVSSFQLELCSTFAPDLAIWTNFFPNHLDRHETLENYFQAKCSLLKHQHYHQKALVPFSLAHMIASCLHSATHLNFFSDQALTQEEQIQFPQANFFWIENDTIVHMYGGQKKLLQNLKSLPDITFAQNWLIIQASLVLLNISQTIFDSLPALTIPSHRIEKVATINNIDFYNDSKGTIVQATLAAVKKLQGKPVILFMGGLSKGVDRTTVFPELQKLVSKIYCFGKEADLLQKHAQIHKIPSFAFTTLEEAFNAAVTHACPGEQLLFSPSGASFDLFAHYQERGDYFKQLVENYKHHLQQSL